MSPCSIFHNITWKFSAFDQFSEQMNYINVIYIILIRLNVMHLNDMLNSGNHIVFLLDLNLHFFCL